MNDSEIKYVIETTINFFSEITGKTAVCGIPSIKNGKNFVMEYTGIIGISGKRKGSIFFTANEKMLYALAHFMLEPETPTKSDIKDLVGEIANTISGNLRKSFGVDFMISVPVTIEGAIRDIKLPNTIESYIIPIKWNNFKSYLVICLE